MDAYPYVQLLIQLLILLLWFTLSIAVMLLYC